MTIHRIPITSREMWLANRQKDVTASAVACLVTHHQFVTPFGLYMLKTGQIQEEPDEPVITANSISLSPMGRGNEFEVVAGNLLRKLRPTWIVKKSSDYLRDDSVRIGASPDFECHDPERGEGNVQTKSISDYAFKKDWVQPDGEILPPMAYGIQAIVEAHLTGSKWCAIGVLIGGYKTEFHLIEIPIHKGVIDAVYEAVDEFWDRVARKEPYDPDYQRDGETIRNIYAPTGGETADLSDWNEAQYKAETYARLGADISAAKKEQDAIKAEVQFRMKTAEVALINGKPFATNKLTHRKAYTVEAKSFPQLRFK